MSIPSLYPNPERPRFIVIEVERNCYRVTDVLTDEQADVQTIYPEGACGSCVTDGEADPPDCEHIQAVLAHKARRSAQQRPPLNLRTATIPEILDYLYTRNRAKSPRYAVNHDRTAIAVWSNETGKWIGLLGKRLDGAWMEYPGVMVNRQPLEEGWQEEGVVYI